MSINRDALHAFCFFNQPFLVHPEWVANQLVQSGIQPRTQGQPRTSGSFFGKDPGIGWSRDNVKIPFLCGG